MLAFARYGRDDNVCSIGLFQGELDASAANDVVRGTGFHELEAIAESIALANHRENFHSAEGKRELQPHQFTERNFYAQQGRDAGLADVDGIAANDRATARINADANLQLESAMASRFQDSVSAVKFDLTILFHVEGLPA